MAESTFKKSNFIFNKTGLQPVSRPVELVYSFGGWVEGPLSNQGTNTQPTQKADIVTQEEKKQLGQTLEAIMKRLDAMESRPVYSLKLHKGYAF